MANIKLFKLMSGEEVLAEVVSEPSYTSNKYDLKNCIRIVYYDTGKGVSTGFAPFLPMSADEQISIKESSVLVEVTPKDEVLAEYTRIFSGIVIPTNQSIIT